MNIGVQFDVKVQNNKSGGELAAHALLENEALVLPKPVQILDGVASVKSDEIIEMSPYRLFLAKAKTHYSVEVFRNGRFQWSDGFDNLVVLSGLNKLLDACFGAGLASPAWYLGFVDGATEPSYAAADTMASHAGWTEFTSYDELVRQTFVAGSISGGSLDNSASRAVFTITSTGKIAGCFMVTNSVKGGTSGTLYGVGTFRNGIRDVESGDVVKITETIELNAS